MTVPKTLGTRVPQKSALPWPLVVGGLLVGLHVVVALLSLVWTPYGVGDMVGGRLEGPSFLHWAGTDRLGRDLMTQIMIGARIALVVGCGAVVLGALIGVTVGVFAAFATRTLDDVLAAALDTTGRIFSPLKHHMSAPRPPAVTLALSGAHAARR